MRLVSPKADEEHDLVSVGIRSPDRQQRLEVCASSRRCAHGDAGFIERIDSDAGVLAATVGCGAEISATHAVERHACELREPGSSRRHAASRSARCAGRIEGARKEVFARDPHREATLASPAHGDAVCGSVRPIREERRWRVDQIGDVDVGWFLGRLARFVLRFDDRWLIDHGRLVAFVFLVFLVPVACQHGAGAEQGGEDRVPNRAHATATVSSSRRSLRGFRR